MSSLKSEKLACSYYFAIPSLAYGLFTSRLPAVKELASLNNADLGSILLCLGISTLLGLLGSNWVISRYGSKRAASFAAAFLCAGLIFASLALNFWQIAICCLFTGLAVGVCDVGVNALGIELEQRYNSLHLSFLHGISSIGGVCGALSGSFFAWLKVSPFFNALLVLGVFCLFWGLAYKRLASDDESEQKATKITWKNLPALVLILGLLSLLMHIVEGSAAEWGSVFMRSIKHAPEDVAALAFAFFTGGMVIARLGGDKLRTKSSDFKICFYGALTGTAGMCLTLLTSQAWLCLLGYFVMGLGLAPIVPTLFSKTGKTPGLSPAKASAIISTFSYSGLLLFPPLLGYLAEFAGLVNALWCITACCLLVALGSFVMKK